MKRLIFIRVIPFILLLLFSYPVACENVIEITNGWKAGAASVDITPRMPMWMAGYGNRDKPGDKVAQSIHAKALALEDARGKIAIILTLDILGVPRVLRKAVEQQVSEKYGVAPSFLLMNASHTHSGPEVRGIETYLSKLDPLRTEQVTRYRSELQEKIVLVIGEALSRLSPAHLYFRKTEAGFAMNRRIDYTLPKEDFRYGKQPNPEGPVDHDVPVLQVTGANGALVALLFGYACHSTTLGDYTFHGDYPGFAQYYLEEAHPGAVALFMAGCGADQNPHPRRDMVRGLTGLDLAKMHGRTLALAVEAALNAFPQPLEAKLEAILEEIPLEYMPAPGRRELQRQAESSNRTMRENARVLLEWLDRDGALPSYYPYPVQVMCFGKELTLVALASEVVVDYSLRLKRELPGSGVWMAAYSNDFLGYVPSHRIQIEGGYEGGESLVFSGATLYRGAAHPNIWALTIEESIIAKTHEIYDRILNQLLVDSKKLN